jgi:UDP-N-acetyl-D-mannosaminuronic acid dehydrogenase
MIKSYDLCVLGGCGHVGLPLAIAFASKGLQTCIYDINEQASELVKKGIVPFKETGAADSLKKVINRTLAVSGDPLVISRSRYVIVVIGTPVDEFLNPKINEIIAFFNKYLRYFRPGQTVILRSTLYPGTSQKVKEHFEYKGLPLKIAYCPERIAEGKALEEITLLPQIVSAFDRATEKAVSRLFRRLTNDIVTLKPIEAEVAKLFTNVWRYIQFAIPNQFLIIAMKFGLDFFKILEGIRHKYPRAKGFYGPGFAAGPCLFKDTMQLASFNNNDFMLGHAAMLVNEGLPKYLVEYMKSRHNLARATVGILGMAFKADNDDPRSSLSYKLKKILELESKKVLCSDPYVKDPLFTDTATVLKQAQLIVLATPHTQYKDLKFRTETRVFDIWNFYGRGLEF